MEEISLLHVLSQLLKNPAAERLHIAIGFEEWAQTAVWYALQSVSPSRITLASLEKKQSQLSLFPEKTGTYVLVLEAVGKKEGELLKKIEKTGTDSLFLFVSSLDKRWKEELRSFSFLLLQKMKPWELPVHAQKVVRLFLEEQGLPLREKAVSLLGDILLQKPSLFSSEMEKYSCFSKDASFSEEQLSSLFCHDRPASLWKLFDAFLARDEKTMLDLLTQIEESGEMHPLQLLRAFRSQWEKLLLASERGEVSSFASQRQKMESCRKRPFQEKRFVLEQLLLYDKKLREGERDEQESLFPLFLSLFHGRV